MAEKKMKKVANGFQELGNLLSDKPSEPERQKQPSTEFDPAKDKTIDHSRGTKKGTNSIELRRSIQIQCWRVIGQVSKATKRTELMPILLRARENGSTDASDIAGHLLFEPASRRIVAQRLLNIAENYKLLEQRERQYFLTDSGLNALETEQVFVPEQGTWTIWASNDPLLTTCVLHIEPWKEPTVNDEIRGKKGENKKDRKFEKLPLWLKKAVGVIAIPIVGKGAPLRIDQLDPKGEIVEPKTSLSAVWDVSASRLRVQGKLNGINVDTAIDAPDLTTGLVWQQLLESEELWSQWDQNTSSLRVNFDDTAVGERESFLRAWRFEKPNIGGFGTFDITTVEGVPIRAESTQDANRWAEWRLNSRINNYATAELFRVWTDDAIAPLSEFKPSTSSRKTLADAAWRERESKPRTNTWHLVAAEDWGL